MPPSVCIVGSGFSGICATVQLKKQLGLDNITVYEMNDDLGGTWYPSYPAAACDVPSHLYSLSFELNPNWTNKYSGQPEILAYLKHVARKYEVYQHIEFGTEVLEAAWNQASSCWMVTIKRKRLTIVTKQFDVFISGVGTLRVPSIPSVFDGFTGPKFHSSRWDKSIDLAGKSVAIVGTGASAIQIIPDIAPKVKHLTVFQRTPTWIMPRHNTTYPEWLKTLFAYVPLLLWAYRVYFFIFAEVTYYAFRSGSPIAWIANLMARMHLNRQLPGNENKELREKITPKYALGCKRIVVADDYYPALARSNVTVVTNSIKSVGVEHGNDIITDDGIVHTPDVLILATGFSGHAYFSPMVVRNKDGVNVMDYLSTDTRAYYGLCMDGCPNAFLLFGPFASLGHNSVVFIIECQINLMIASLREMMKKGCCTVEVKRSAIDTFRKDVIDSAFEGSAWAQGCASWYLSGDGMANVLWTRTCTMFWWLTRSINKDHFMWN
ncbi:putative flavoprotein [Ramicandelaber brevisporus]|nr:putative flavoprotein [Ramicandelaber brevisporus]